MVSHSFKENAEEFLENVLRATSKGDVMYICALSNYQAEDGAGPSLDEQLGEQLSCSPFFQVITYLAERAQEHKWRWWCWKSLLALLPWLACAPVALVASLCESEGMVSIFTLLGTVSGLFLHMHLQRNSRVCCYRLLVVPTWKQDIYQRLWCIFEIFVAVRQGLRVDTAPTMASAGHVQIADAGCSKVSDEQKIRREIDAVPQGHAMISKAMWKVAQRTRFNALTQLMKCACLLTIPWVLHISKFIPLESAVTTLAFILCWHFVWINVCYFIAKRCQGAFNSNSTLLLAIAAICLVQEAAYVLNTLSCKVQQRYSVLLMSSDFHAAALIYTAACCSRRVNSLRMSWKPVALMILLTLAYNAGCHFLLYAGGELANLATTSNTSFTLYLSWAAAKHWGLSISRGSSKHWETLVAWVVLAILMCWYLWIPDWTMAYTQGCSLLSPSGALCDYC
eukprot:TRINITY_DN1186_c1_g2_i2.p1 TRINITY_DN1186_c1_g2~~TRINITY_DN1186_c1_g2_i2.p1  ORF type:complete len:474 (-),score=37.72 TRINITY_DN1186_c1_g2_i2:238-1593(-)